MTRAAVCVMGADPFLNAYWLRNFATWSDEVDELRVIACGLDPDLIPTNAVGAWQFAPFWHAPNEEK